MLVMTIINNSLSKENKRGKEEMIGHTQPSLNVFQSIRFWPISMWMDYLWKIYEPLTLHLLKLFPKFSPFQTTFFFKFPKITEVSKSFPRPEIIICARILTLDSWDVDLNIRPRSKSRITVIITTGTTVDLYIDYIWDPYSNQLNKGLR